MAATEAQLSSDEPKLISNPGVSWREESFGALCYNFSTRDLFVIKSPVVAAVLNEFSVATSRNAAIKNLADTGGKLSTIGKAIDALCDKGVLVEAEQVPNAIGQR